MGYFFGAHVHLLKGQNYHVTFVTNIPCTIKLALLPPGAFSDQLDLNPDSDSKQLDSDSDSDSRKKGWIRIQLDSDSRCLDSDPDSRCLDSHITDWNHDNSVLRYISRIILG